MSQLTKKQLEDVVTGLNEKLETMNSTSLLGSLRNSATYLLLKISRRLRIASCASLVFFCMSGVTPDLLATLDAISFRVTSGTLRQTFFSLALVSYSSLFRSMSSRGSTAVS